MENIVLDYEIAKPVSPGTKAKAPITDIKTMRAEEVFGSKAKNPQQALIVIYANVNDSDIRIATFNKPISKQISAKSKLALFKQRYGQFPKTGMKVDVETNASGYWNLVT